MPVDPGAVGATSDPVETSWDSKDALLYAVGIGAGTNEVRRMLIGRELIGAA